MKKILILCPDISGLGGVEKVVINLANDLCKDNSVIIGTLYSSKAAYKLDETISVHCLSNCRYKYTDIISYIIRKKIKQGVIRCRKTIVEKVFYPQYRINNYFQFVKSNNIEVIIGVGIDMTIVASFMKERKKEIRVIGWQHNEFDVYFNTPGEYYYGLLEIFNHKAKYIDTNIVLTRKEKNLFIERTIVNTDYIYNPLCIDIHTDKRTDNWGEKNILFVGRIAKKQKGIDYLVEVLEEVLHNANQADWSATIVGDGPDMDFLINEINNRGLQSYVHVVGGVNDVSEYYSNASIFLSTSRWEGFGLVISEALYYGLSVVAFDNEGPSEMIQNGINGYIIPKFDVKAFSEKIIELMENEAIREKISHEARLSSLMYLPDRIYDVWRKIL